MEISEFFDFCTMLFIPADEVAKLLSLIDISGSLTEKEAQRCYDHKDRLICHFRNHSHVDDLARIISYANFYDLPRFTSTVEHILQGLGDGLEKVVDSLNMVAPRIRNSKTQRRLLKLLDRARTHGFDQKFEVDESCMFEGSSTISDSGIEADSGSGTRKRSLQSMSTRFSDDSIQVEDEKERLLHGIEALIGKLESRVRDQQEVIEQQKQELFSLKRQRKDAAERAHQLMKLFAVEEL